MKLENASINQWEQKCNSDGGSAVELTIRADVVKDDSYSTFCIPDVRRDFENYISQYKYGDGDYRDRTEEELESVKKYCREWQQTYTSFRAKLCDIFDQTSYYQDEDDIIARVKAVRDVRECTERRNTELIKENEELKEKVKDLEEGLEANLEEQKEWRRRFLNMRNTLGGLIECEYDGYLPDDKIISHFSNLVKSFRDLTDKKYELSRELDSEKKSSKKAQSERAKLEKDLMDVADILQVTGPRTITDIFDKAHYWVHERSINYEALKDILRMDSDASREDILDRIEKLCRFRDDVMFTFGIKSCDGSDIRYKLSRAALLAEKTEFICGYFDVKQVPLTSLAENLCIEIKEKVISEYKADAAKKAGPVGNGVYLDGLTVEQNLRAENVRLKAENEKYKTHISELEESLDCIHCEAAAALGYECE